MGKDKIKWTDVDIRHAYLAGALHVQDMKKPLVYVKFMDVEKYIRERKQLKRRRTDG